MSKRNIDDVPNVDNEQLPAFADIADIEERCPLASSLIPDEDHSNQCRDNPIPRRLNAVLIDALKA